MGETRRKRPFRRGRGDRSARLRGRRVPVPQRANARNAAKFEPGVPFVRERTNIHHFNGLSLAAWANFPPHGLENPLFLAENAKFIKDLWSAG